ncbi:protein-glucosylgalactosylhydroxylysine glucosidase-like [Dreissena polymorpha]|uniref:Protein-glucosylgalactosylhydroxylysine glucosidase n=1 Tax=Dreissena polymorpha TaxID=45954 RepID=A0A9D4L9U9_DREPO|nr:protein-glucosylgalactosylhydroxylysine glucosidase-like [Dreissena polymorpha]KAH3854241.1 hypothetical protein DPMN_096779 [Dreissena polymorpha]
MDGKFVIFAVLLSNIWTLSEGDIYESEAWDLCTDTPPTDAKLWPSISNGHLGTVVHSDSVYMNGLYNGNGTTSTRARIPAMTSLKTLNIDGTRLNTSFCLHMDTGTYEETYRTDHWKLTITIYAHRVVRRVLVTEVSIATDGYQGQFVVPLQINHGNESTEISFLKMTSDIPNASYMYGKINEAETSESGRTPVHVYSTIIPPNITIASGQAHKETHVFLMSISPDLADANSAYKTAINMHLDGTLQTSHVSAWRHVWDAGRIDVNGNVTLASTVNSALYYIISSMPLTPDPLWEFNGLSPADLAHNGYNGHMFWDQDTWMYPPVLQMHADLGAILVQTRLRTLNASYEFARRNGYSGAQYAWESAFTGLDVTPWQPAQDWEIHVTGDVSLAFHQYLMMTGDVDMLRKSRLQEAIFAIADFWRSRATLNATSRLYEIHEVMPPDEWHYPVNNSVYTNYVAKQALLLPMYVCKLIHCKAPPQYEEVATKMYLPYDPVLKYHPEYDGYTTNVTIKQGDAILLSYPLQMQMSDEVRYNNLAIYEKTTGAGPAMTWGMFAIGWLDVNQSAKAEKSFFQQLDNKYGPFNIWTEDADGGGVTNFITGQGGYLQSIINGYGGIRVYEDELAVHCRPIPGSKSMQLVGIDYRGNSVDIWCDRSVTRVNVASKGQQLFLRTADGREQVRLNEGVAIEIASQKMFMSTLPINQANAIHHGVDTPFVIVG